MILKVINSGSTGNCYLFIGAKETLIVEIGVKFADVKKELNFDLSKVVGALVTHEHLDHCKGVKDATASGVNIYTSFGTAECLRKMGAQPHRLHAKDHKKPFFIGEFKVMPFDVQHDAADPCGWLIEHPEMGKVLFITDTYYISYTFKGLNHVMIEANYSWDIINQKIMDGKLQGFIRDRVINSHMSLETCLRTLAANDLTGVENIVLLHLSDSNSCATTFQKEVTEKTGKTVNIAMPGLRLSMCKDPF